MCIRDSCSPRVLNTVSYLEFNLQAIIVRLAFVSVFVHQVHASVATGFWILDVVSRHYKFMVKTAGQIILEKPVDLLVCFDNAPQSADVLHS